MSKKIFLLLTVLVAIIIGWPHLSSYSALSVGDHGRDFYAFEQVFKGQLVYKDIWWVYGPLMPYYYGLFYLLFGVKMTSILLGKFILNILCGVLFYLSARVVMPAFWAFLAACFFLHSQQDFFFTFNHIGGIVCELAVFWFILKYLYENTIKHAHLALVGCFVLGLIKINFGISTLVAALISVAIVNFIERKEWITSQNKLFYISGILVVPLLWLIVYGFFLSGLTIEEIRQCMPYFGDDQPYHRTPFQTIPYFLTQHWLTFYHHALNLQNVIVTFLKGLPGGSNPVVFITMSVMVTLMFLSHLIIHGSTVASFIGAFSKKISFDKQRFWLALGIIALFFTLNLHEFAVSGVWYRNFWSQPFLLFLNFFMVATAMSFSPRWVRLTIGGVWIAFIVVLTFVSLVSSNSARTPDKFLNMPRGQIYVSNESEWVDTLNKVTAFLNQTLKKDEFFFALPYDCIYYYLTAKQSPTRQLIFFDHIKILPPQEVSIIKELEAKNISYVVMSNRIMSSETGLGIFGKTYCPLIYKYIMTNFTPVFRYGGNWESEPGWGNNHGVVIFKRK